LLAFQVVNIACHVHRGTSADERKVINNAALDRILGDKWLTMRIHMNVPTVMSYGDCYPVRQQSKSLPRKGSKAGSVTAQPSYHRQRDKGLKWFPRGIVWFLLSAFSSESGCSQNSPSSSTEKPMHPGTAFPGQLMSS
jgi:hypothetical protein